MANSSTGSRQGSPAYGERLDAFFRGGAARAAIAAHGRTVRADALGANVGARHQVARLVSLVDLRDNAASFLPSDRIMGIIIDDELLEAAHMSEPEIKLELAILLYQRERLTLGQAARLAGLPQVRMRHALAARGLGPHYGVGDFEHDLDSLQRTA